MCGSASYPRLLHEDVVAELCAAPGELGALSAWLGVEERDMPRVCATMAAQAFSCKSGYRHCSLKGALRCRIIAVVCSAAEARKRLDDLERCKNLGFAFPVLWR